MQWMERGKAEEALKTTEAALAKALEDGLTSQASTTAAEDALKQTEAALAEALEERMASQESPSGAVRTSCLYTKCC